MSVILTILIFIFGAIAVMYTAIYLYAIFIMSLGFIVYSKSEREKEFSKLKNHLNKTYPVAVKIYAILAILILMDMYC